MYLYVGSSLFPQQLVYIIVILKEQPEGKHDMYVIGWEQYLGKWNRKLSNYFKSVLQFF